MLPFWYTSKVTVPHGYICARDGYCNGLIIRGLIRTIRSSHFGPHLPYPWLILGLTLAQICPNFSANLSYFSSSVALVLTFVLGV